ncbi:MAG TPA: Flp pilus assembly protein CpaB [Xanthobacteraceae bacterium]|nr:Flp pilus assembly protein CpaB [Xanthobacteraceae bacterium]
MLELSVWVSSVRTSTIVMIGFAVVFGLLAVFVAQAWLNRQAELRLRNMDAKPQTVATRTIVVAAAPLRFGTHLSAGMLREVAWPEAAIPAGTFASINDLMNPGKRIVLASIEPNEPILRSKITGPGQRATLSAVIDPGMKAVTVRVNDVEGVGGFVLPGDHVDVLMTRQPGNTDVVLQNAKVLAVDQLADDSTDKPTIAKAVTLEVEIVAAQKLSLAASLGNLSLVLRKAGEADLQGTRRVTAGDLGNPELPRGVPKPYSVVVVTRGGQPKEYNVSREGEDWRAAAGAAGR